MKSKNVLGRDNNRAVGTKLIRHINPLMFDVTDDKPEGFIMYIHEPARRVFIHNHIDHERVYVL